MSTVAYCRALRTLKSGEILWQRMNSLASCGHGRSKHSNKRRIPSLFTMFGPSAVVVVKQQNLTVVKRLMVRVAHTWSWPSPDLWRIVTLAFEVKLELAVWWRNDKLRFLQLVAMCRAGPEVQTVCLLIPADLYTYFCWPMRDFQRWFGTRNCRMQIIVQPYTRKYTITHTNKINT